MRVLFLLKMLLLKKTDSIYYKTDFITINKINFTVTTPIAVR